jgi:hypothetical protein
MVKRLIDCHKLVQDAGVNVTIIILAFSSSYGLCFWHPYVYIYVVGMLKRSFFDAEKEKEIKLHQILAI